MKLIISLLLSLYISSSYGEIKSFESDGNLEPFNPVTCIDMEAVSNRNTPSDLFVGISDCIAKSDFKKASKLYLVARAYFKFDTLRVEDRSAHQAFSALRQIRFSSLKRRTLEKLQNTKSKITKNRTNFCVALKKLGKPDYHPKYMIQHGMGSFLKSEPGNELVKDFDPEKAWDEVLSGFVKCNEHT